MTFLGLARPVRDEQNTRDSCCMNTLRRSPPER